MFVIRIDTYESKDYPIVRHEFRGKTQMECEAYFNAHMKTDSFLRACMQTGNYGKTACNLQVTKFTE